MRFCGDSLSEVSNCSLDLCKSGDSRRILASALIYAYPPLKDSAPWLCTLALHPGSAPYTMELGRLLYLLADAHGANLSRHAATSAKITNELTFQPSNYP